ncbi:MAG: cytochrome c biogenesis CcdA family protein [Gordonia sp. (in: high G+C Gram-positive bacteria)]|uniref:cytochrome c biogenesis CcdA family protein n=1 Tax=Gordonia sp. (in: high G+C Gram-positive bacteria) TaxID=84139 RepID=UPI0039E6C514
MSIGLLGAFLGGVLTLLSPCSVMLLPAFFSYAFTSPGALVARTGIFYLGLITTLVPFGILAGTFGAFVKQHQAVLVGVVATIVILLGVVMLLGIPLPTLSRASSADGTSTAAVYALGTVYGLAGGFCSGPLVGAVLGYAAISGDPLMGGIILLVYAAGMVVPLLILAALWDRLPVIQRLVRPRELRIGRWSNTWTSVVGGLLTIVVGILLLLTDGTTSFGGLVGASTLFRVESWIMRTTSGIPDIAVVLIVAAALGAAWAGLRRRRRSK